MDAAIYKSQSARDAQSAGYGKAYCDYLEGHAQELSEMYAANGDMAKSKEMISHSLGEALRGNDGI